MVLCRFIILPVVAHRHHASNSNPNINNYHSSKIKYKSNMINFPLETVKDFSFKMLMFVFMRDSLAVQAQALANN